MENKKEFHECVYNKNPKLKNKKWMDGYIKIINIKKTIMGLKGTIQIYNEEKKMVSTARQVRIEEEIKTPYFEVYFTDWESVFRNEKIFGEIVQNASEEKENFYEKIKTETNQEIESENSSLTETVNKKIVLNQEKSVEEIKNFHGQKDINSKNTDLGRTNDEILDIFGNKDSNK